MSDLNFTITRDYIIPHFFCLSTRFIKDHVMQIDVGQNVLSVSIFECFRLFS